MDLTTPRIGEIRIVCDGLRYKLQKYCICGMLWWKTGKWLDLGKDLYPVFCITYFYTLEEAMKTKEKLEKIHDWEEVL